MDPTFSIIVPTYARPKQLATCLEAIAGLDYPRERFEVLVVDDGGDGSLEGVVAPLRRQINVRLLTQPHAGPAAARNTGAAQARGQVLVFIDDDCAPAPGWLRGLTSSLAEEPGHLVGGRTVNALEENPYAGASQMLIAYLYEHYTSEAGQPQFFATCNLAVPKERFLAVGGFDSSFPSAAGEDREFCDRWQCCGHRMIYAPQAIVYHYHDLTLRAFWRQHVCYGRAAYRFHALRASRNRESINLEPLSFYLNLLRHPFLVSRRQRAIPLAMLLTLSQVANAVGFLWARVHRRPTVGHRQTRA